MELKLFNDSVDKKNTLSILKNEIYSFLSLPSCTNFKKAYIAYIAFKAIHGTKGVPHFALSHNENIWIENMSSFLLLFYKKNKIVSEVDKTFVRETLNNLIMYNQIYDCYELSSQFGIVPNANFAADFYNQNKKIDFLRLCMKRWENRSDYKTRDRKGKETILKYYLSGVVSSFISFDNDLDNDEVELSPQEKYYYCLTSKILDFEFEQISTNAINTIIDNENISLYYKGLIFLLRDNKESANDCFKKSLNLKYSALLLNGNVNELTQPQQITINPENDDYSVFDDYFHYYECYIAFNDVYSSPGIYNIYKGDSTAVENQLIDDEAYVLSRYLYNDLYGREINLSEEEYEKRIAFFNQKLINEDGNQRSLFFDTEMGIERLGNESAENQIALTIKMYKFKDCKFYANLIYYYYFKKMIDQEAVINLSMYVLYIAKIELGKDILKIGGGTGISLMALKMLTPFYDCSTPIKQLFAAIPAASVNVRIPLIHLDSDYNTFKKEAARKRLEIKLKLGEKEFNRLYRFMTIIDKIKQIDAFISSPEFDNPVEDISEILTEDDLK